MVMVKEEPAVLSLLCRQYNSLLRELKETEGLIDDPSMPYFERERTITEFLKLTSNCEEIIEAMRIAGYIPSKDEILNGFPVPC